MTPKKPIVAWLLTSMAVVFFTTASAAPRNVNSQKNVNAKLQLSQAQHIDQKRQTEAAYRRLLKISNKNLQAKSNEKLVNSKPRLIKTSFKSNGSAPLEKYNKSLKVTATAYTSHVNQTDSTPNIAAWGDRLKSGMKVIAVSRDLLNVYGLKHKQKVRIKGLKGEYLVMDKMNKRWRKKIDIYMGMDKKKAIRWGRRPVVIYWNG